MVIRGAAEPLPLIYQDVLCEYLGKYLRFFFVILIENVVKRRENMIRASVALGKGPI